jgi:hypothetical protein
LRRALAISLLVSFGGTSVAGAQEAFADGGVPSDGGVSGTAPVASPAPAAPAVAPPLPGPSLVPSTQETRMVAAGPSPLAEVPVATWICAGVAAALLGVGLGFGVSAGNIDHRAGVTVSASGVDQGLTRSTALAGQTDATVANGFFIGAGVVALVGLAFAAFAPEPTSRWNTPNPVKAP